MWIKQTLLLGALCANTLVAGQAAKLHMGAPFSRLAKNLSGDVFAVLTGVQTDDGYLLYVEDNMVPKVVRVDKGMNLAEELVLQNQPFDGLLWNGVAPFMADGTLYCLLASTTKKTTEYAIGQTSADGRPALNTLRRVASSVLPYKNDPTTTLPYRPLPDAILFSQGLMYANTERIVATPDGKHYLLNHHTLDTKGNKQFWFSYLDQEFTELWSGTATLPYPDTKSRIHQVTVSNDGVIHLLAYVFPCEGEERKSDKLCHELHLTTLSDQGKTVKDILMDKDFVSSARMCEREGGKISMAIRYGALTGQPGWVLTLDPADPKLKTTPLVDQRIASIRKTKLLAYGSIEPGAKKGATSRTAKVPNEVVQLLPAWNGLVLVETFLETNLEIPVGEAIAIRRLAGDVRTSFVAANDSIQWQHVAERAHMTTAGLSYDGVGVYPSAEGLTLLYAHTPKGLDAIMASGSSPEEVATDGKKPKKDKPQAPSENGVLKALTLDSKGAVVAQGTALIAEGTMPCSQGALHGQGSNFVVKCFDRKNSYSFALIDASVVGK